MSLTEGLKTEREGIMINLMDSDVEKRWACFWETASSGPVEGVRGGAQEASWEVMLTRLRRTSVESGVSVRLRCRGIPTRERFL